MKDKFISELKSSNTTCLSYLTMKSDLNLKSFQLYIPVCHILDCYWINYEMQLTISLLGGPQCHIRQTSRRSHHS